MTSLTAGRMPASAAIRVVGVMWWRELLRYRRDRSQLFGGLSRTVLWLLILGFGLGATLREIEGYTYAQYILPGIVTLNVLFASLQSAFALVHDRKHGLLGSILIAPTSLWPVVLGKLCGGATLGVIQGSIPLAFAPLVGVPLTPGGVVGAWLVMFSMGFALTGLGVLIATRGSSFENFGSISNGVIQPLYFLSGSIFPLKGIVGGVGFLDIPPSLREGLREHGIHAIGGGWVVELPIWLEVLVRMNPISYQLDLMRHALLDLHQLPLSLDLTVCLAFPALAFVVAALALERLRQA